MSGGSICVARALPIDAALVGTVLGHLRRDTRGTSTAWTLGTRGSAQVDVDFYPVISTLNITAADDPQVESPAWTTGARLWDPEAVAMVKAVVAVTVVATDACELTIRPDEPLTPWWEARRPALLELAQATIDELAEELLWHASAKA
jgi:hypothetical protein